jgi:hypothetical protein
MIVVGGFISGTMSTHGFGSYAAIEEYIAASMTLKQLGISFLLTSPLTARFTLSNAEGEIQFSTLDTEYAAPKQLYARLTMKFTS